MQKIISREISQALWTAYSGNLADRARDLWNKCSTELDSLIIDKYLDIGSGTGNNTMIFGRNSRVIVSLDIKKPKETALKKISSSHLLVGDGSNMPFDSATFDLVSSFAVIEYMVDPKSFLKENFRVLKPGGCCVIQTPNLLFPIDLHTGFPGIFFVPTKIRNFFLKNTQFWWVRKIYLHSLKRIVKHILELQPKAQLVIKKVNYSPILISQNIRSIYNAALKTGALNLIPLGYIVIIKTPTLDK
ncbi:MAG: class I SAM-dependent methyltransferase [Candidatus Bathyarchaeota archaeon]|nr:class I SAM-dependent methyltransferase [Candidatus Bathyarchaeota archaeon]